MATPVFYDTHAHLDFPDFASDLDAVIGRAGEAGIEKIVCIGTDFESSRGAIRIAESHANVFAAVGWHPSHVTEAPADIRAELRQLAAHPKVVAIGETGLDYYRLPSKKEGGTPEDDERYKARQGVLFEQQLEVAAEFGLNVVIHQRECLEEAIAQFTPYAGRIRAVFHCFANDAATMRRIIDLGSVVSFTGILTFKNGQNIRETLAATPPGHFMFETDCPYLAPVPFRGKRCEPAYVKHTAETAAAVKNCSLEELSQATCETAKGFFKKL